MKSSRLSKTAAYIAIKFYGITLAEPFRSLFDEDTLLFYDRLVAGLPFPLNKYHSYLKNKWIRKCAITLDELFLPGDLMHILLRKYHIQIMIEKSITSRDEQLIILGAGFDHLGKTYAERGLQCFELDVPRMAHIKQTFLSNHRYHNKNLTVYPINFSGDSLSDELVNIPQLNPETGTIVVAEGFFDYLTPEEFKNTVDALTNFFSGKVTLISTVFSLDELTPFRSFIFKSAVLAVGEQLKLHYGVREFIDLFKQNDFHIISRLSGELMKSQTLAVQDIQMPVLSGFYLIEVSLE